jgi:hypothetical protein
MRDFFNLPQLSAHFQHSTLSHFALHFAKVTKVYIGGSHAPIFKELFSAARWDWLKITLSDVMLSAYRG